MAEVVQVVRIVNPQGLHARPCHAIVALALGYESELRIANDKRQVNGKSILELMTLNAPCDTELTLTATGEDAGGLVDALKALVAAGFDEHE